MRRLTEERPLASRSAPKGSAKSRLPRRLLWIAACGVLALVVWCGTLYAMIVSYGGEPKDASAVRADVGIVLGAGLWGDEPSPALKERLDYAIELYDDGMFGRIIVTGGKATPSSKITDAEGARNYLTGRGIPEDEIALDNLSKDTYENLTYARDIMAERGWQSAVVVTHGYHGSRAADMARKLRFSPVQVQVTDSKVLSIHYHEAREVLAYTKWLVRKPFL
ncbi:YdcF family protein [Cohnella sp. GCM10027633]|uniref:YdcF family protein n=1 Tax=unclassified Cohnella TaxID=2636738 RepID=UPI003629E450